MQGATRLHIRPGMDVFSAYQNQFIGSVVGVHHSTDAGSVWQGETGSEGGPADAPVMHEGGGQTASSQYQGKRLLGEEMGPVPTMAAGNSGPLRQSAEHRYATGREDTLSDVTWFTVRPGRLNLGMFTRPLYIPVTCVHSISMERIVLNVTKGELPPEWRHGPPVH